MKKPAMKSTGGLNPNKAKRRPGAWQPSPVKKTNTGTNKKR